MVEPIYIVGSGLGIAFLLGVIKKAGKNTSGVIMLLTLAFLTFISTQWLWSIVFAGESPHYIFTAGFNPPFSINLLMGKNEAILTTMINSLGVLGGIYLWDKFKKEGVNSMIVYLLLFVGLNVVIMTRDIFNLFVFLEISSVAIAGLVILQRNTVALSSGFKYLIATAIISGLLLLGIIFTYQITGSLYLDDIFSTNLLAVKGGAAAVFLILIAIVLELKPFPANGWGLDLYQSATPGLAALVSGAFATAMVYVLFKIIPIAGEDMKNMIAGIGAVTFIGSNLLGIKQGNARRLLGYSSVGQIGLLVMIIGLSQFLGEKFLLIAGGILISHYLAKAGLFWLAGILNRDNIREWSIIRKKPFLLAIFGTFIFALIGFPPFPSFFAKWELVMQLSANAGYTWIGIILLGSFLEGVYLFRWLGYAIKLDNQNLPSFNISLKKIIPVFFVGIALYVFGYFATPIASGAKNISFIPITLIVLVFLFDFIPARFKNIISIAALAYYGYMIMPGLYESDGLRFIFSIIFLIGGVLTLIPGFAYKGKRPGFYPAALLMFMGLGELLTANTMLHFFFAWELMTIGSYILIIRGKNSIKHGYSYMLFSVGGAYLMLAGFGIAYADTGIISLGALSSITTYAGWAFSLIAIGFMTKTATLGVHIWLPGAHAEAESDVSPMVSAILLKAGVFGLILLFISMGAESAEGHPLMYVLGWLGAITALIGNLSAVFQEDAKRLLAYSSIGQLGYILFAFAIMTHVGWLAGFTYSINHFMYKAILFLIIGGIVLRLKTHNMYEMGGLIKRMPFSFIGVLIAIVALSGLPPLSGFAGKWLFYNASIGKGWYFQGAVVFFSGIIAFLYLYRLIHSVFLGQIKDKHRTIKEISPWFLIPAYILIMGIMAFSAKPELVLQPFGKVTSQFFPSSPLVWENDGTAIGQLGYWNGSQIMIIVMGVFAIAVLWLAMLNRNAKKVKQFNIVYAAERPERPETTHIAYNMFAGYNKAVGFLITPWITGLWNWISDSVQEIAGQTRRIYNGNGQTYMLHVLAYVVIVYLITTGGF
ncbi:MAG: proton-conducting transporter membrane subunit [Bacteroidota bacterium]